MDCIWRFILEDLDIRSALLHLGSAWRAMQASRHYADPTRTLLGEMTAVTALIGCNLKTPGRISFQLQGHGAIRQMVIDCDDQLRFRGYARTQTDPLPGTPQQLFGDGQLVLTLHANAANGQPYQSFVPLEGDSIAEVFENYLALSEQTPSRLWLKADAAYACGLFLQKLPNADNKDPDGWNRVQMLADTVTPAELLLPAETLLSRIFREENVRLFAPHLTSYHCPRDEEKVVDMLRSLGRHELEAIVAEHGAIVVQDEICNHEYRFGPLLIDQLFPQAGPTFH